MDIMKAHKVDRYSFLSQSWWLNLGQTNLIAVLYFLIARISLIVVVQSEVLAIIWPPSRFHRKSYIIEALPERVQRNFSRS